MARLSKRFSRYFSLSRLSKQPAPSPKISKSQISHPIASPSDTHALLDDTTATPTHSHSPTPSTYTISDAELHALEQEKLSHRLAATIDDILTLYQSPHPTQSLTNSNTSPNTPPPSSPFANPPPSSSFSRSSPSPSASSVYDSPPPTPPTLSATLQRFRDTPPPAPGWDKVSFGRETGLFGPEGMGGFGQGFGQGTGKVHGRRDWRGEFGRRGYAVL